MRLQHIRVYLSDGMRREIRNEEIPDDQASERIAYLSQFDADHPFESKFQRWHVYGIQAI